MLEYGGVIIGYIGKDIYPTGNIDFLRGLELNGGKGKAMVFCLFIYFCAVLC